MNKKHLMVWKTFCALILILSIMIPSVDALATDRHHSDEYIDIIVRYHEEVPSEDELDPNFKNIRTMTLMPVQMMSVPASSVKDISQMENVKRVTYDQEMSTTASSHNQTVTTEDWNQDMIGAFDAREEGMTGQNVRVAVLDTGFYDHEEITYAGGYSIFDEQYDKGADPWTNDHHGHGTHVSSIIGAHPDTRAQGVAPGVDLFGVKIYHEEDGNRTRASNLMEGLQWAINNEMDIINISSGYSQHDEEVYNMIKLADSQGILIVAASGNSTESNRSIDFPARHDEVIAVANVDQDRFHAEDSMIGPENELAAPGRYILGLDNEPGGYDHMSGTSQATPHVAGIAALLMQKYPNESAVRIRARMTQKARDLGPEGRDTLYGYGLVHFLEETIEESEPVEEDENPAETDESEEPSEEDAPDTEEPDDLEESDSETEEFEEEEPSESESPSETEEDTDAGDNDEESDDVEEPEEEETDELLTTVWIRPSDTNGIATINDGDISAVADSGVLAISFDSSLEHLQRVSLTSDQVSMIRERNITLLIARIDMEWVIPANNLEDGNALLSFESLQSSLDFSDTAKSDVIEFSIEQDGQQKTAFPNEMAYRFFTDEAEINQDHLYEWNTAQGEWVLLGDTYTNGGVVGNTASVGIFAVFNSDELTSAIVSGSEDSEEPEETEESVSPEEVSAEEDEADESSETTRSSFGESETEIPVVLAGAVVIMTTVGGGFYFFGGKSKQ